MNGWKKSKKKIIEIEVRDAVLKLICFITFYNLIKKKKCMYIKKDRLKRRKRKWREDQ